MAKIEISRKTMKLDLALLKAGWSKTLQFILGREADKGLIFKLFIYLILIDTAFIYLNPIFYMITTMVKDSVDLLDPGVQWVPTVIYFGVLQDAWDKLRYVESFMISFTIASAVAVLQTISCAVAGYAFARLSFPFKKFWFFCLLLTFIVPPQVTILPTLLAVSELGLMNSYYPMIIPALFGHGLKGALFVIIFRQFFSTQPKELEEAAKIDGANVLRIFYRVMLPLAKPAILVVFLFSFVWSWNDYYLPSMFMITAEEVPLSMGISRISAEMLLEANESGPSIFDEPLKMAASFLIVMPPLLLYTFTQRWFVEGVERTGLVE